MNVFILNTGRCGSTTFYKACKHITNYTVLHESRLNKIGEDRFNYPDNHIESDNRLSWLLGRLDNAYGDNAFYVHLRRNNIDTAKSFTRRYSRGIIQAYRHVILPGLSRGNPPLSVALDYCDTVNSNIELFLKNKSKKMEFSLENADEDFVKFWNLIEAKGDINSALEEFKIHHNASKNINQKEKATTLIINKLERLIIKFPYFIRNA